MITLNLTGGYSLQEFLFESYQLSFEEFIVLFFFSLILVFISSFFSRNHLQSDLENNLQNLVITKYSFGTKLVSTFLLLIIVFVPIFQLLKIPYTLY